MPPFKYFLLDRKTMVVEGSSAWGAFLPASRRSARGEVDSDPNATVTCGDYFKAVRTFLEESPHHRLALAVSRQNRQPVSTGDLDFVDIFLEKHGQFYHPARVLTAAAGRHMRFVVNAAVTETGRALIGTDFDNLRRLNLQFPYRFLPRVYQLGEVRGDSDRHRWTLFLGQWLEGYREFHLQQSTSGGGVRMVVWDPIRGGTALGPKQTASVYRLAARILTAYCNLSTSEQIGNWHHAAGDFVLRIEPTIDLKLVTVRQYRPLLREMTNDIETVVQALLLFLLNMSVRMRIDRDDGTGDLLWAAETAVAATVDGFFEGLDLQVGNGRLPEELPACFRSYLKTLTAEELKDVLFALAAKSFASGTESVLVRRHLTDHSRAIYLAIGNTA